MNGSNIPISRKKINIFIMTAVALGILGAALRTVSLLSFYDKDIAYFQRGAIVPIILYVLYAVSVIAFAVFPLIVVKDKAAISAPSWRDRSLALIPAGTMIYYAITQFSKLIKVDNASPVQAVSLYDIVLLLVAVVSIAFFVSLSFSKRGSILSLILSFGFFLWIIVSWITTHLEFYTAINSPDKMFFHFGSVGAALFMVSELRSIYECSKPKLYYFSLGCAIFSLFVSSIPYIIGIFANAIYGTLLLEESIVHLALLFYTVGRALNLIKGSNATANEEQKEEKSSSDI